jgi:hypothetical protein
MTGEGGAASECLLTISVGAFVGTLPRMRPAVSGKRAAIAEGLYLVSDCHKNRSLGYQPLRKSRSGEASLQYARADAQSRQTFE